MQYVLQIIKGSTVDIIQYVGRCLRKCTTKPNKISCVIVPFILDVENEIDFFDNDSTSFQIKKNSEIIGYN